MKVLVTGATGFVGAHVCHHFLGCGDEADDLDNPNDYYDGSLNDARLTRLQPQDGFAFSRLSLAKREARDTGASRSWLESCWMLSSRQEGYL